MLDNDALAYPTKPSPSKDFNAGADTPKKDFQQKQPEDITPRIIEPESDKHQEPSFKEDVISEIEKLSYPISPAQEDEKDQRSFNK